MLVRCLLYFGVSVVVMLEAAKVPPFMPLHNNSDSHASISAHFNPCQNFYAYSCASWFTQTKKPPFEPIWNPWISTNHKIRYRLSKILTRHDPKLVKPIIFYRSCLKSVDFENRAIRELISLVRNFGGWPLVDDYWKKTNYDWFKRLTQITQVLDIHPVVKIHADLDYTDPNNVLIYIEPGELIFPQYILTGAGHGVELEAYENWILGSARHVFEKQHISRREVKEIVKFEMRLAKMSSLKSKNERMTVGKLMNKVSVDWLGDLSRMFKGFIEITPNTTIAVKNYEYLKNLFLLVDRIEKKTVANYLIWCVIKEVSRDTSRHMQELNFLIDQAILGVKDDLSRDFECIDNVIKYFSPLLVPSYLKLHFTSRIFTKVRSMVESIKSNFMEILNQSMWLSKKAKLLTVDKIKKIRTYLGYPSEIFNGTSPEHFYRKWQMTNNHFTNIMKLKKFKREMILSQLISQKSNTVWPSSPFDVNAYYSVLQNSIFIPLGLLELPFFSPNRDEILNYGALGFLIGHEMSHSLDPTGILADFNGKITNWLPDTDLVVYKNRTKCFGDGITMGETIADVNGLKISFLKNRTLEQSRKFFVSFAQMWCEISEETDIFTGEEHAPNVNRVQKVLNNENFRDAFECGSVSTCDLW